MRPVLRMHNLKKNMYTSNIYYMNPVSRDFPTHELVEVLFLKQYGFGISFYYIVSDEIPGFFLLLKNHIFIARSEDTIFIFRM